MFSLRDIAQPVEPASASDKGEAIYARFEANPDCLLIPVLDDYQRPLGLIERNRFLTRLAGQYGRAVFGS
ncbi:MAG TPA: hypothetical protein VFF94_08340, partial [Novosphingobium sp.]|nr:hypothetical protein [Novosphingobium sp.]